MRFPSLQLPAVLAALFVVGVIGWHFFGVWVPLLACVVVPAVGLLLSRRRSPTLKGR